MSNKEYPAPIPDLMDCLRDFLEDYIEVCPEMARHNPHPDRIIMMPAGFELQLKLNDPTGEYANLRNEPEVKTEEVTTVWTDGNGRPVVSQTCVQPVEAKVERKSVPVKPKRAETKQQMEADEHAHIKRIFRETVTWRASYENVKRLQNHLVKCHKERKYSPMAYVFGKYAKHAETHPEDLKSPEFDFCVPTATIIEMNVKAIPLNPWIKRVNNKKEKKYVVLRATSYIFLDPQDAFGIKTLSLQIHDRIESMLEYDLDTDNSGSESDSE